MLTNHGGFQRIKTEIICNSYKGQSFLVDDVKRTRISDVEVVYIPKCDMYSLNKIVECRIWVGVAIRCSYLKRPRSPNMVSCLKAVLSRSYGDFLLFNFMYICTSKCNVFADSTDIIFGPIGILLFSHCDQSKWSL